MEAVNSAVAQTNLLKLRNRSTVSKHLWALLFLSLNVSYLIFFKWIPLFSYEIISWLLFTSLAFDYDSHCILKDVLRGKFSFMSRLRGSTSVSCAKFTSNFPNYGLQKIGRPSSSFALFSLISDVIKWNFSQSIHIPVKKHNHAGSIKCSTEAYLHDLNFPQIASSTAEEKVGVLLLNLGGPETLNDVQPFLYNLFADPVSYSAKCQLLLCYRGE